MWGGGVGRQRPNRSRPRPREPHDVAAVCALKSVRGGPATKRLLQNQIEDEDDDEYEGGEVGGARLPKDYMAVPKQQSGPG
jgi:hypothetical protein